MFEILFMPFAIMASVPGGAFVPAVALCIWTRRRWSRLSGMRRFVAAASALVWLAYAAYETWMYFWMRSVVAPIRVDLLVIGPILVIATVSAIAALWPGRGRPVEARQPSRTG